MLLGNPNQQQKMKITYVSYHRMTRVSTFLKENPSLMSAASRLLASAGAQR